MAGGFEVGEASRLAWAIALGMSITAAPAMAAESVETGQRDRLPASERPLNSLDVLIVNTWNVTRIVVVEDREGGVRQLASLVDTSDFEEHWAFLPSAGLWVELGLNETVTPQATQVEVDTGYLGSLLDRYNEVHLYHFHPLRPDERPAPATSARLGGLGAVVRASVAAATPGPADIVASFDTGWIAEGREGAVLKNFVISAFGVVEFGPTEAGLRRYGEKRGRPLAADDHFDFAVVAGVWQSAFALEKVLAANPGFTVGDQIEALCAKLSSADYRMTFEPIVVIRD